MEGGEEPLCLERGTVAPRLLSFSLPSPITTQHTALFILGYDGCASTRLFSPWGPPLGAPPTPSSSKAVIVEAGGASREGRREWRGARCSGGGEGATVSAIAVSARPRARVKKARGSRQEAATSGS
eukprot:scaffold107504_cov33-Tisochrysis_lutea.AAC.3